MFYRLEDMDLKHNETRRDVFKWCDENLLDGEIFYGDTTVFIESDVDAMAFELRWK